MYIHIYIYIFFMHSISNMNNDNSITRGRGSCLVERNSFLDQKNEQFPGHPKPLTQKRFANITLQ